MRHACCENLNVPYKKSCKIVQELIRLNLGYADRNILGTLLGPEDSQAASSQRVQKEWPA